MEVLGETSCSMHQRAYLATSQRDNPIQERAWARALDDIGAVLDRYAGGPSPRYAYSALLAIKTIVEEVRL
jgi:hypothetical protein